MVTGGTNNHQARHRNRQFTVCPKTVLSWTHRDKRGYRRYQPPPASHRNRQFTVCPKTVLSWTHTEGTNVATGGTSHHQARHRNRQFTVCPKTVLSWTHTEGTNVATGGTSHHQARHRNRQFTVCSKAVLSCRGHTEGTNMATGGTNHHQARHLNRQFTVCPKTVLSCRGHTQRGQVWLHDVPATTKLRGAAEDLRRTNPVHNRTWTEGLGPVGSNAEEGEVCVTQELQTCYPACQDLEDVFCLFCVCFRGA